MSTPEIIALQMQLVASAEQLQLVLNAMDLLLHKSSNAITDLRHLLAEARQSQGRGEHQVNFVSFKSYEGGRFGGKLATYKTWSKHAKIFCNAQCHSCKCALKKAEGQENKVTIGTFHSWGDLPCDANNITALDEKLYIFLVTYMADEVLGVVENC